MANKGNGATTERTYTATVDELNAEIKKILDKRKNVEYKEVRSILLKEKKDWIVPERRVAKFLKRQKMGKPIGPDEEDSVVSGGSFRRRFFGGGSVGSSSNKSKKGGKNGASTDKKEAVEETSVPKETTTPSEPSATQSNDETKPGETVAEEASRAVEAATDDNDGRKTGSLDCCVGCVIL